QSPLHLRANYYRLGGWIVTNLDSRNLLQKKPWLILAAELGLLLTQQSLPASRPCTRYSVGVTIISLLHMTDQLGVGDLVKCGKLVKVLIPLKILLEISRYRLKSSTLQPRA